jgi:hypothetical protein
MVMALIVHWRQHSKRVSGGCTFRAPVALWKEQTGRANRTCNVDQVSGGAITPGWPQGVVMRRQRQYPELGWVVIVAHAMDDMVMDLILDLQQRHNRVGTVWGQGCVVFVSACETMKSKLARHTIHLLSV